jgi:hypothetical protein
LTEVPANTHDELLLWHALHRLEATYWYDVDFNEGHTAHEFLTPDGVKMVGHNRFNECVLNEDNVWRFKSHT